jgi:hypothetical protein
VADRTESTAPTPANTITLSNMIAAMGNIIWYRSGQRMEAIPHSAKFEPFILNVGEGASNDRANSGRCVE